MSAPQGVPVLGINRGTTGFLTELEVGELQQLRRLFTGEYTLEQRMMLEFTILRDGKRYHRGLALNDVTVQRGIVPRLLTTDVHNGDLMITRFRGDGVIVATPTGSTGYALSAGGPVIDPRTNCIEVAPICAHSLANRSIVFGSNAKLTILPRLEEGRSAHLFNDGASSVLIHHGDTIAVQRARQKTTVVRMKPDSFYSTMRIKLREF
ncbi:MAG: NAD(+)/NADH kinase, partial [Clostridiales bacterium]|nr:NAD(+)/NADH kinase [Clostridiales bacterium]